MDLINNPYNNQNYESFEQLILSIMLNDNQTIVKVIARLEPKHFLNPDNRVIFREIKELYLSKNSVDPRVLITYLENEDDNPIKNVAEIITSLMNLYTSSYDLDEYIELIIMESTLRELRNFGNKLKDINIDYYKYDDDVWNLQKEFLDIINSRSSSSLLSAEDVAKSFLERMKILKQQAGKITGTRIGLKSVDEFTNGFQPGELIILAARPSIGKTALALNMLLSAAKDCKENECVLMFSLEMGSQQLFERLISSEVCINSNIFKHGTWESHDDVLITTCLDHIKTLPLYIDDSNSLSILEIQTKLKQIATNKKIKLVVVDYLQLISGFKNYGANRQIEVAQISRTLKSLARDIDAPIIAIAQLSRKIEERRGNDKKSKPLLSDLRESGSIEQDADIVIFLNYDRDEYDEKNQTDKTKQYLQTVVVDFIIAKNRSGPTGEIKLLFEKAFGKYSDYN